MEEALKMERESRVLEERDSFREREGDIWDWD